MELKVEVRTVCPMLDGTKRMILSRLVKQVPYQEAKDVSMNSHHVGIMRRSIKWSVSSTERKISAP